jgi:DDE superfamily endonuclease
MPPFILHPSYILRKGLEFLGVDVQWQATLCGETRVRLFKAHYGRHPLHLSRVYRDLQVAKIVSEDEAKKIDTFTSFLLANNFLRCYEEGDLRYCRFGIPIKDISKMTWSMIDKLDELKNWKIKCPAVWPAKLGASVDGTHAPTNEPRDPNVRRNPKNFSYKHNVAGLTYQIVLSLWTQEIWYADTGNPASTHDMTAIRKEFVAMVPDGCRVVADSAYGGKTEEEKRIFSVENNLDCEEMKELKARAKSRHESINSRLKVYKCMRTKGRHGVEKHKKCFSACLVLLQYAIEDPSPVGEPLFTI